MKKIKNEETEYLKENYDKIPIKDIAKRFGVVESTVYSRMGDLGISNRFQWTQEKEQFLIENYATKSWDFLFEFLKTNNKMRILQKASQLGLKRTGEYSDYTQHEINFLKKNYFVLSLEEIGKHLRRSSLSVYAKANNLGLRIREPWTKEELSLLKEFYPHLTNNKLKEKYFPNREIASINMMATKNGIGKSSEKSLKWHTKEEMIELLIKLSERLGRTPLGEELVSFGLPSSTSYRRYFGSYFIACELAGLKTNSSLFGKSVHCYSINNDLCLSGCEKVVTDFFIENNIEYKKEQDYSLYIKDKRCGGKIVDWIIGDCVFVEYFGLSEKPQYKERMNKKIKICKENNVPLISLFRKDLTKLHLVFSDFI